MVEMVGECIPPIEMRVDENGEEVVVLKGAGKGAHVRCHGDHDENGVYAQGRSREVDHGVVILHRAWMV